MPRRSAAFVAPSPEQNPRPSAAKAASSYGIRRIYAAEDWWRMASNSALGPELPSGYSFPVPPYTALTICLPIWPRLSPARIGKTSYDEVRDSIVLFFLFLNSWLLSAKGLHSITISYILQHFLIAVFSISPSERFPDDFSLSTSMSNFSMVS